MGGPGAGRGPEIPRGPGSSPSRRLWQEVSLIDARAELQPGLTEGDGHPADLRSNCHHFNK